MNKKAQRKSCSLVLSVIALLLSVVSILIVIMYTYAKFPITEPHKFDYLGIIVGIFSVLITVLIGWNIYALIDLKQSKEYINDKLDDYDHEISGGLYQAMGISKLDQQQYYEALFFFINGIKEQNMCSKPVYTENLINMILKMRDEEHKISLNEKSAGEYIEALNECTHRKREEAINYIKSLKDITNNGK